MSIRNPNSNVLEILEQTKWFSYDDIDDLVYFLQGRQIEMMDSEDVREEAMSAVENENCEF